MGALAQLPQHKMVSRETLEASSRDAAAARVESGESGMPAFCMKSISHLRKVPVVACGSLAMWRHKDDKQSCV